MHKVSGIPFQTFITKNNEKTISSSLDNTFCKDKKIDILLNDESLNFLALCILSQMARKEEFSVYQNINCQELASLSAPIKYSQCKYSRNCVETITYITNSLDTLSKRS